MKIESVYSPAFRAYGQVLTGYDTEKLLWAMEAIPLPKEGTAYEPSIAALEGCDISGGSRTTPTAGCRYKSACAGGAIPSSNCLEYHRDSEVNIGASDFILLLAKQEETVDGRLDTACVRAFRVPAGAVVEVYATTLHYAPAMWMGQRASGWRWCCPGAPMRPGLSSRR